MSGASRRAKKPAIAERLDELEEKVSRQVYFTVIAALIAAVLGSGGVAGILTVINQKNVQQADARLKVAEASSKEFKVQSDRHNEQIKSMQRIINELNKAGQPEEAKKVTMLMLQQEADFNAFLEGMLASMRIMWQRSNDPNMVEAGFKCERVLGQALQQTENRRSELLKLLRTEE